MASYGIDWTGRFRGQPSAVVRPGDGAEVAAVVAVCKEAGVALVPQGGNTGLVGGGVPLAGEVVLSLRRLAGVTDVDPLGGQLSVGAGTTIADVQAAAASAGWAYGVDLASRDSATIGGTIATNAGGLQVLRHGSTRAQLVGFEAVLGTGETVSHMGGLIKDNTGYDLGGLALWQRGHARRGDGRPGAPGPSEPGACDLHLGLLLHRGRGRCGLAAAPVPARAAVARVLPPVRAGPGLSSERHGAPFPGEHRAYLLAEAASQHDPMPAMAAVLDSLDAVEDVAVATDPARRAQLWRYREGHTEAINTLGAPHKLDVTLPAPMLAAFIDHVPDVVRAADPGATTWLFGHVGDGNVHVNVTGLEPDDLVVDDRVMHYAAELGGSISSEHGIGTAKRPWLHLNRSDAGSRYFEGSRRLLILRAS